MKSLRHQIYATFGLLLPLAAFALPLAQLLVPSAEPDSSGHTELRAENLIVLGSAAAAAATMWWLKARIELLPIYLVTYFHEMGHGATAALIGGSPEKLEMRLDGSGSLAHRSSFGRLRLAAVSFSGYPYPALAALAAAQLQTAGLGTTWLLLVTISAVAIALTSARTWWAFLVCTALAATSTVTLMSNSSVGPSVVVGLSIGILIRGSYESAQVQLNNAERAHSAVNRPAETHSDAEQLHALLGGSATTWARLHLGLVLLLGSGATATTLLGATGFIHALWP